MNISSFFETKTRDDGKSFVSLKDERPEWLQDAVYEAHINDMPMDWVYAECEAAASAFDDGSLPDDDSVHEHADGRVDVYTKNLFMWAADMCLSSTYSAAEEEANDLVQGTNEVVKILSAIQYCAIARIARTMLEACQAAADDGDEDEQGDSAAEP